MKITYAKGIALSLAMKILNKHNDMKIIVGEIYSSKFINLEQLREYESKFLDSIKITNQPQINLYELYKSKDEGVMLDEKIRRKNI